MIRVTLGFVLVVIFAFAAYFSWIYAYSNTFLQSASLAILVERRDTLPSLPRITLANAYTDKALSLTPTDPDTLDLAGRIRYLEAISLESEHDPYLLLQAAKKLHTSALQTRQYWPYSHVNMVYVKSSLGEIDQEYSRHFELAYELGLDDRAVTRDLIYLGINDWIQLDPSTRELTVSLAEKVLEQKIIMPNALLPYFSSERHLLLFCAHLRQFPEKAALCRN
jgi:hypothetical protein